MNIFSSSTSVSKLEAQLKQKSVQMDNLDSSLIATKRELAQQRRERELAEQELASRAQYLNELEEQNNKLSKLLKQKNEYAFSLSSQVEAKNKEIQQQEDQLQQEKARAFHTSKELQEAISRQKALELQIARANSTASFAERSFRAAQTERGKEINDLSEELVSAQHNLEAQQAQLASFEAKVHNGQVDSDNRMHTVESLKAKVLSLENLLMAERSSAQKKLHQLEETCEDATQELKERRRDSDRLQALLDAKEAKLAAVNQENLSLESQLQAMASGNAKVDRKSYNNVIEAKDQLEQHNQELQMCLDERNTEAAALESKLSNAAAELDDLRAQVESGKASSDSRDAAFSNMQISLAKHKEDAASAAIAHEQAMAKVLAELADSERSVGQLKSKTSELEGERDTLNEKLRRGADAISQTSKLQAKLEGKLSKLESDKAAAEKEAADAKATAAGLERDMVEVQRCTAKTAQERQEARQMVSKLESEVGDLRGRIAELDVARTTTSHHVLAAPNSGGGRNYAAVRDKCLALEAELTSVKRELADARAQLKEETSKREEAKAALISEQQYFASKLTELEGMTHGAPSGTPGSQVHAHIQRMKKQLQAVGDGEHISRVAKRTMLTPAPPTQPQLRPPARSPLTPKTSFSQPRLGSDGSPAHSATPRSGKGLATNDSAQYWHRRYEEQSTKISQLETANRNLRVQLLRSSGTTPASVAFASLGTPAAKTPTLGQVSATPPKQTGACRQLSSDLDVRRELDFTGSDPVAADLAAEDRGDLGQENSGGFGSVSPALGFIG